MDDDHAIERIEGDDKDDDCDGDVNNTKLDGIRDPEVLRLMHKSLEALCRK